MLRNRSREFPGLTVLIIVLMAVVLTIWTRNRSSADEVNQPGEGRNMQVHFPNWESLGKIIIF